MAMKASAKLAKSKAKAAKKVVVKKALDKKKKSVGDSKAISAKQFIEQLKKRQSKPVLSSWLTVKNKKQL